MVAVAIKLAEALDALTASDAPTSQAVVADKLTTIMVKLRALAPAEVKGDVVDELASRRPGRHSA